MDDESREDDSLARLLAGIDPPSRPRGLARAWAEGQARHHLGVAAAPLRIDRFTILDKAGAGGMCVVFAAWDPRLERRVALKVLRAPEGGASSEHGPYSRLQREARAMARLSHPNVAAVHDIGLIDLDDGSSTVYIAMEFIEGQSLAVWQQVARPTIPQIVDAYIQAGRGLEAAHAAQLVHRDFKPHNVMRDTTGRVRVLDFGLVRDVDEHLRSAPEGDPAAISRSSSASVTRTRGVVGTPAYMAPEQLDGEPASAASDQFSFCVALHEAIYGRRPFDGHTPAAIAAAMREPPPSPTRRAGVPARLRRAIARGLDVDPARRWPGMAELLAELEGSQRRSRALRVAAWAGGAALVLAFAVPAGDDHCLTADATVRAIWNDANRADIRAALTQAGQPFADDVARRVAADLDAYASELGASYRTACVASRDQLQSADLSDRQGACLDTRRGGLRAAIDVLRAGGPESSEHALDVVGQLDAVDPCLDRAALLAGASPPSDPESAAAVASLREELAAAEARRWGGQVRELSPTTADLLARSEATGYRPLVAEVQLEHGFALQWDNQAERGCAALQDAHFSADGAGQHELAATAAARVLECIPLDGNARERAELWYRNGKAAADQIPDGLVAAAELEAAMGNALFNAGDPATALERLRTAAQTLERRLPADDPRRWQLLSELARTYVELRRFTEATEAIGRARAAAVSRLGPTHPEYAVLVANAANAFVAAGDLGEGERLGRDAVELLTAARGRDHIATLRAMGALAGALTGQDRWAEAAEMLREVHEGLGRIPDADRFVWAAQSHNYASVLYELERYGEALPIEREVYAFMRDSVGDDDRNTALVRNQLGNILVHTGNFDEAEEHFRGAVAAAEASDDVGRLEHTLDALGHFLAGVQRPREAAATYRRIRESIAARGGSAYELAVVDFRLAELADAQGQRRSAVDLAARSLAALRSGQPPTMTDSLHRHDPSIEEVETWIDERRPGWSRPR